MRRFAMLLAVLLLLTVGVSAQEQTGSLTLFMEDGSGLVLLYRLGSAQDDGCSLEGEFSGYPGKFDDSDPAGTGQELAAYTRDNRIPPDYALTLSEGSCVFPQLQPGTYLLFHENDCIQPFVVRIPTVINDEAFYHIHASPKAWYPDIPDTPQTGDATNLPLLTGLLFLSLSMLLVITVKSRRR